jgi:hypothetical protein
MLNNRTVYIGEFWDQNVSATEIYLCNEEFLINTEDSYFFSEES